MTIKEFRSVLSKQIAELDLSLSKLGLSLNEKNTPIADEDEVGPDIESLNFSDYLSTKQQKVYALLEAAKSIYMYVVNGDPRETGSEDKYQCRLDEQLGNLMDSSRNLVEIIYSINLAFVRNNERHEVNDFDFSNKEAPEDAITSLDVSLRLDLITSILGGCIAYLMDVINFVEGNIPVNGAACGKLL